MGLYEDATVLVDERGITVKNNGRPGKSRMIEYGEIREAQLIDLRFGTGKYRLVGISPGRPRTFFHWDRDRTHKPVGISLDTGRWLRRAITPEDPGTVIELIEERIS